MNAADPNYIAVSGLRVAKPLFELVRDEIAPGAGVDPDRLWMNFAEIIAEVAPKNRALLAKLDQLQRTIDSWFLERQERPVVFSEHETLLRDIRYLVPEGPNFSVKVDNVDDEISRIAGPQLVVPVDNSRYALNAANARWGSLYDALYGTDVIAEERGCRRTRKYNPVRGVNVIRYARDFLDRSVPVVEGSHSYVVKYVVRSGKLIVVMGDGTESDLKKPECFVGYTGDPETPSAVLFRNNELHIELRIGEGYYIGRGDLANIYDIHLEAAVTTIMDCEDSIAAVDAEDKVRVYRNWLGLMTGSLKRSFVKYGETVERVLEPDRIYTAPDGGTYSVSGRSLMLIRNVGLHMYTDAVTTAQSEEIPEGFLDAMITVLAAKHDLLGNSEFRNSRTGSIYIVKPKLHGPEEVAATVELFERIERALELTPNTIKIGIMDEERRTTVNLKECIRAAKERVMFINTGFLDRTGDEIHTCMEAGATLPKMEIKNTPWLLAYENWNVDVGLESGLPGNAQIGKGMWTMPDNMQAMLEAKGSHPKAGASTAWVPSPTAAVLHAMHYHEVHVADCQKKLMHRGRASLQDILTPALLGDRVLTDAEIQAELDNNAQGILGYVVRWIDQGIGCSKVPDINNCGLMEDRATLRISSQHIANWLHHDLGTSQRVQDAFERMAVIVDRQNAQDPNYRKMAPNFAQSVAYRAALDLVFEGREVANGYTEPVLHRCRREAKSA